jgi:hypothetical protein
MFEKSLILNEVLKKEYSTIVDAYASMLYQICNDIEPWNNINCEYALIAKQNDPLMINEVLHELHTKYPSLRKDAIKRISDEFVNEVRVAFYDYPVPDRDSSRAKPVPEAEEILNRFSDDIVYRYGMTYFCDHTVEDSIEFTMIIIDSVDPRTTEHILRLIKEKFGERVVV